MRAITSVSDYLENEYLESALYMNYRSLPSYIDGLKVSGRKCIFTVLKRGLKDRAKVINFAGAVIDASNYLHGNTSLEGTLVTLSQDFCGSENIPILRGEGGFGTRHTPEAAAARYIFVKETPFFSLLFRKDDAESVKLQEFEGDIIEPVYYVPTLPLLLVNGCFGVGVGFKNNVLARSPKNIIKALKDKLTGKKVKEDLFKPAWKGFEGDISFDALSKSWIVKGKASLNGRKLEVEEIPISWDLQSYLKKLKTLKERGVIEKYVDFSENDKFKFTITLSEDESEKPLDDIYQDCGLSESVKELLNTIDENNAPKEFDNVIEIFNSYYKIKIKHLGARIKNEIEKTTVEVEKQRELVRFIEDVIADKINMKATRKNVETQLTKLKYKNISFLIGHPLYSLTKEEIAEAKAKLKEKEALLKELNSTTPETVWLKDIEELETSLKKEGLLF